MRHKLNHKGIEFEFYKPKSRSKTSASADQHYQFKSITTIIGRYERIDLMLWLNGLFIIVIELKHGYKGQNVDEAI